MTPSTITGVPPQAGELDSELLTLPRAHRALLDTATPRARAFGVDRCSDETWDRFVGTDVGGTFCHLRGWRELMSDVLGHEDRSLMALDPDGRVLGLLPLVRVRSQVLGHFLVSMPFLNSGGPIGTTEAQATLVAAARLDAQTSKVDLLELRARTPVGFGLIRSDRKITVRLGLSESKETDWKALPSKLRSQIRRPQREGLVTRFGLDQREAFYELFSRNMRALGTPVLPSSLFERIARDFPDLVEFGVVWKGDEPIAAGCGFAWKDELEITWAASAREHRKIAPNMLLYWEFMDRARNRGAHTFDFGRCTRGSGTHAFKQQWGGTDVALPWAQWSARQVRSTPTPDRGVYKFASACWRHLPLAVTNRVGPWLAARIP